MKYIKKFNEELKSDVYYSAAKKVSDLGIGKENKKIYQYRSSKFKERGDLEKSIENKKEWLDTLENFKGKPIVNGTLNNEAYGNFYISLEIEEELIDSTKQPIEDGDKITIYFYIGFVPADEETYKECEQKIRNFNIDIDNGCFVATLMAGFSFRVDNANYYDLEFYYHDHVGDFNFAFIKDYKALKNRFVLDLKSKFKEDIDKFIAESGIGSDYGIDFTDIYNFMKNYNVNDLVK